MDQRNKRDLEKLAPREFDGVSRLLLDYNQIEKKDVPDPYYGGTRDFELVLDLVEQSCIEFLKTIVTKHGLA